ncbi:4-hydroxyphenylacetate catabolism regulatory protein HpaA [Pectobacteriaceae bacterium CE90]|nr:4-hydroxyphenylacetate catabolism regulatory protein HpaA [Prodigiosinella sp. LS101]WJV52657.1 4-hydroxyphenylacetate catabolism regulatory protein HpaA [Prodigiosinella sp. LS101]WJV57011.1 4-hydroxyphenylacetate catabolism regulatory protein HpaA [Pectobacteriaceae bacterium C111]WJY16271.1 4-hydroxyphenylacetate catabolism regulatory protein HpaA [Pectobacteriaceae bacterium CE90]
MPTTMPQHFENIDISKEYDARYGNDDVHYETFARLAAFFGRDMRPHWHDRYFQLHFLATGEITLQLEDHFYAVKAPLFVLTPPSVPHAFFTEPDSDGHVLTVRQELIWPLIETLWPGSGSAINMRGICLSLESSPQTLEALNHYWPLIAHEFQHQQPGRDTLLSSLALAIFTLLLREAPPNDHSVCSVRGEMKLFQRFNRLVDDHFRDHFTVSDYSQHLGISESRLTELCKRFANQPPKRLIFERVLRDAKRLLLYSSQSVHQIAFTLGYKDPAYFARFFNRMEGCAPSKYRHR